MTIFGVDIAGSYQGGINIAKLKAEGFAFVVCKATEGTSYSAPRFDEWIPAIKANGMIPGAYHYIRNSDGAAQARFFLSRLAKHGGPAGMLIQLDCEADASWPVVQAFVAEWNAKTGNYPFAFYTGDWWLQPRKWNVAALTPYLWAAPNRGYTGTYTGDASPDWNAGYGGYAALAINQYTSKGDAGGLNDNVDIDAIRDPAVLEALVRGGLNTIPAPKPVPGPAPRPVWWVAEDGDLGPATIRRWQGYMGTPVDGVISRPSKLIERVQEYLNGKIHAGLLKDGILGPRTIKALQRYLGTPQDGVISSPRSAMVKALQHALNTGRF